MEQLKGTGDLSVVFSEPLAPAMRGFELRALGLTDSKLEEMRRKHFGPPAKGERVLKDGVTTDDRADQELRKRVYDQVMRQEYAPGEEV